MNNVLMTHYDLDGVGCDIVLSKLFNFKKRLKVGYNRVDEYISNGYLMFYDACFVTDLSLKSEHIQRLTDEYENKFFYSDHHIITEDELHNCDIKGSTILFNTELSSTANILRYFHKSFGSNKEMIDLARYISVYDMWQHDKYSLDFNQGHALNVLFWYYKYDYFFERFKNGFKGYTKEEHKYLKNYYANRKAAIDNTEHEEIGRNSIVYIGAEQVYINEYSLLHKGYDAYYIIYIDGTDTLRLSIRSDREDCNFGKIMNDVVPLFNCIIDGGGHKQAAGMSFKPDTDLNDVFNVIEYINLTDEKKEIPYNLSDIPF